MKKILIALGSLVIAGGILGNSGCDSSPSATEVEARKQEQMTKQGIQQVGMPAIINYQEKRVLKQILELRDTAIVTVTYIVDLNGKLHKVCDSIGYGIPYATQFTNPGVIHGDEYHSLVVLPQADPNGLYSPPSAEGTWVQCTDPATKKLSVVYLEPRVIVSPYPLVMN